MDRSSTRHHFKQEAEARLPHRDDLPVPPGGVTENDIDRCAKLLINRNAGDAAARAAWRATDLRALGYEDAAVIWDRVKEAIVRLETAA
jgi:hypothetical protein